MSLFRDVADLVARLPSDVPARPTAGASVHTLYWPADRFGAHTVRELGEQARAVWSQHAPDPGALARICGWEADDVAHQVHAAVTRKLGDEPVEDLRIDFEDGYGLRPGAEEDAAATTAGTACRDDDAVPRRIGLRTKALTAELAPRAVATLERFALAAQRPFVLTVPKVTTAAQVELAVALLTRLERALGLPALTLSLEIMVEVPQAVFGAAGQLALPPLLAAGGRRLCGVHVGVYDFMSAWEVPPHHQHMDHPACDLLRGLLRLVASGRGLTLSAGSTNTLPVGDRVEAAWRASAEQIQHALRRGYFHGWDLHPAQLPIRFAANYRFYLEALPAIRMRLEAYAGSGADATTLDDAPTVAALVAFVRRARACGAIDSGDLSAAMLELVDAPPPE